MHDSSPLRPVAGDDDVPKLFVNAEPGVDPGRPAAGVLPALAGADRGHGAGGALRPEDAPDEIGRAIADWLRQLR